MFTIFVVLQFCVRAGTNKAVCVSPSPWIKSAVIVSFVRARFVSLYSNCTTLAPLNCIRTKEVSGVDCYLLRRKRVRPRDCQILWRRGGVPVVRASARGRRHAWACAAYCLLGEYHIIMLALWFVTPCYAPISVIPCLCNTKNAGCCALVAVA